MDVAGFGDRRRTNFHQVAVRDGLYRVLTGALHRAGVALADCDHEDRGDGVLVIIPPTVAKSVLVEDFPEELGAALREYNQSCCAEERIQLRLALHAGEIQYDDHGVAGWAVNLAFRLLDARVLKQVLAESGDVLAIITSSWFFEEVIWHSPTGNRAGYHQVRVQVKETETTAWICLPGKPDRPRAAGVWPSAADKPEQHDVPRQLPAGIRQFVGREYELIALTTLLDSHASGSPTVIITAIDGTAGIGKTALVTYWAHQAKDRFPDGQLHVNLRGFDPHEPVDPGHALHGFLQALGVAPSRIPTDLDARAALYRTLIAGRRMLIVLDNAHSTNHVRPLLPGTSSCLAIITSRNRLDGLVVREGAHRIALDLLSTRDARDLIARRVNHERLDAEPAEVAELIELCARLPLALSVVAARLADQSTLPISELVHDLRDERGRLDALDLGHLDLDLRAVFSWSYAMLSPPAARLFRLLGLHPGPDIEQHACAALLGDASQTGALLRELTSAHLLEEHGPRRYRFHDLLRTYAGERAAQDEPPGERTRARRGILEHYLDVALVADVHIQRCRDGVVRTAGITTAPPISSTAEAMAWFTAENATLLATVPFAMRHGFNTHAARLAWACTTFLRRTSQRHERAAVHRTALTAAHRSGDRAAEAVALECLARAVARLGRYEEALANLDEARALYRALGDDYGEIQTLLSYASVFEAQQQYAMALEYSQSAWRLVQRTGNRLRRADTLTAMGRHTAWLGRHAEALPMCEQALELYAELEHPEGEADALAALGYIRHCCGQHAVAVACYERSLALDRQLGDQFWEASTLDQLGDAYLATGEYGKAGAAWSQAIEILDALRLPDVDTVRAKLTTSNSRAGR